MIYFEKPGQKAWPHHPGREEHGSDGVSHQPEVVDLPREVHVGSLGAAKRGPLKPSPKEKQDGGFTSGLPLKPTYTQKQYKMGAADHWASAEQLARIRVSQINVLKRVCRQRRCLLGFACLVCSSNTSGAGASSYQGERSCHGWGSVTNVIQNIDSHDLTRTHQSHQRFDFRGNSSQMSQNPVVFGGTVESSLVDT